MDPYELFDLDFKEFVKQGIIEFYGDHPGNGMKEIMEQIEVLDND